MANLAAQQKTSSPKLQVKSIMRSSFDRSGPLLLLDLIPAQGWVACSGCTPETQQAPLPCREREEKGREGEKNLRPTLQSEKWGHEEVKECKEVSWSSTRSWNSLCSRTEQACNYFQIHGQNTLKSQVSFSPWTLRGL